jgi:hypothetical protein
MGRSLPYSKALIHEVYEEMNLPLLPESNTYSDVPFWVDVPAEKEVEEPKGMLMIASRLPGNLSPIFRPCQIC